MVRLEGSRLQQKGRNLNWGDYRDPNDAAKMDPTSMRLIDSGSASKLLVVPLAPLMRRRNVHVLAILRHRSARQLNALPLQFRRNLVIGERPLWILVIDQLAYLPLQQQQRRIRAFRTVCSL